LNAPYSKPFGTSLVLPESEINEKCSTTVCKNISIVFPINWERYFFQKGWPRKISQKNFSAEIFMI
jgi:hypothetical protein